MSTRPSRKDNSANKKATTTQEVVSKKTRGKRVKPTSNDEEVDDGHDDEQEKSDDEVSINSDNLDDDIPPKAQLKRKRAADSPSKAPRRKSAKRTVKDADADDEVELEDRQEVAGVIVQAPTTGQVPPGEISQNTLDFLSQLEKPECNNREWFRLHEPVYRQAAKEWQDFVEHLTDVVIEVDPQIPYLPPKDIISRINRGSGWNNSNTIPYWDNFAANFSRSGRKRLFAGFYSQRIWIAAGIWDPEKAQLATIIANLLRSSKRLRKVISDPFFVAMFGPPDATKKQNIFRSGDELKVAPKGIDKNHKDIDLLRCRSFGVNGFFDKDFIFGGNIKENIRGVLMILRPFVYCMNDLMTPDLPVSDDDDESVGSVAEEEIHNDVLLSGSLCVVNSGHAERAEREDTEDEVSKVD